MRLCSGQESDYGLNSEAGKDLVDCNVRVLLTSLGKADEMRDVFGCYGHFAKRLRMLVSRYGCWASQDSSSTVLI